MQSYLRNPALLLVLSVACVVRAGSGSLFRRGRDRCGPAGGAMLLTLSLREGLKQIGRAMWLPALVGQQEDSAVHIWANAERGLHGKKSLFVLYDSEQAIV